MRAAPLVVTAVVGLAWACGGTRAVWRPEALADSGMAAFRWPPPPLEPRVGLLGHWTFETGRTGRRGFAGRVLDVVAGGAGRELGEAGPAPRPAGIAIGADSSLLIADARAGTVVLFRPGRQPISLEPRGGGLVAPLGVAAASGGVFYVSDVGTGRLYRYAGESRWLEPFAADLAWARPVGIAVDTARRRVVVVDTDAHLVRVLGGDGTPLLAIGGRGAAPGQFNYPTFAAVGPAGEIVIVDAMNFRIQVFDADGQFVRQFGSAGDATGYFAAPKGICADGGGHLFVADARFAAVHVYDLQGRLLLAFGHFGREPDGFALPTGVACDGTSRLYVADTWNGRIGVFRVWPPTGETR